MTVANTLQAVAAVAELDDKGSTKTVRWMRHSNLRGSATQTKRLVYTEQRASREDTTQVGPARAKECVERAERAVLVYY